jgi:hypothetical protein
MRKLTKKLKLKAAQNVADTMMAHYDNHNVVTDGLDAVDPDDSDFTEEEIELCADINMSEKEFKDMVIKAVTKNIKAN